MSSQEDREIYEKLVRREGWPEWDDLSDEAKKQVISGRSLSQDEFVERFRELLRRDEDDA